MDPSLTDHKMQAINVTSQQKLYYMSLVDLNRYSFKALEWQHSNKEEKRKLSVDVKKQI